MTNSDDRWDSGTDDELTVEPFDSASAEVRRWDVVDGVECGADPTGAEPLGPVIERCAGERTALVLPEGRYLVDEPITHREYERFAIVGDPRATLVATDPALEYALLLDAIRGTDPESAPSELRVENLTFDFTTSGVGPVALRARVSDHLVVANVEIIGRAERLHSFGTILPAVTSPTGTGVVNVWMTNGCTFRPDAFDRSPVEAQTDHPIGILSPPDHRGTIRLVDCRVEDWVNNGLYLSGAPGGYVVEGGTFRNNGNANVRLGENDVVRGARVVVDNASESGVTGCGIWAESGHPVVEDCAIDASDTTNESLRITSPGATVRDTRIEHGCDTKAVAVRGDRAGSIRLERVDVLDTAPGDELQHPIYLDRSVLFTDSCISSEHRKAIICLGNDITLDRLHIDAEEAFAARGENLTVTRCTCDHSPTYVTRDGLVAGENDFD